MVVLAKYGSSMTLYRLQVNYKGPDVDKAALHLSVIKGKQRVLKLLLEYNPDLNIKVIFSCVWKDRVGAGWGTGSGECFKSFILTGRDW